MKWLEGFATIVTAIGLRFVVPIVVTIGFIEILRTLDARWQMEAEGVVLPILEGPRCFEVKKCTEEQKAKCIAASKAEPCWQVFRETNNGLLKEECLECGYFSNVTSPVGIRV